MVAIEAMASGLPVIASRQGGLSEVLSEGTTGFLFSPGDWRQLAGLLETYLEKPWLRINHGRAARQRSEQSFDISQCAARFEELFIRLRDGKHARWLAH
jgi:glycosyltransferase involved in cell wall biosynthesis